MPKKNLLQVIALLSSLLFVAAVAANTNSDQPVLDCEALANSLMPEPEGYAEQCMDDLRIIPVANPDSFGPTDTAYIFEMRNWKKIATHLLNNFPVQTQIAPELTNTYFGWDFDYDVATLYAHEFNTNMLGTINLVTGAFSPIGSSVPPGGKTLTGLAIDPSTNQAYVIASDNAVPVTTLYSVNLATGALTTIGDTGAQIMIDLSINCAGEIYGHDIVNDAIYTINRSTGAATFVGSTGLTANFAQGMDFDNNSGTLYIYAYTGGGTNTYGTVNLNTGAVTPLFVNNPLGEYEGATQTVCDSGALTYYSDRSAFNAANPGLPVEDFEEGNVTPSNVRLCGSPINSNSNDACFSPGDIIPGVNLQDRPDVDEMILIGSGVIGNPTKAVGPNTWNDQLEIVFTTGSTHAAGMDFLSNVPGVPVPVNIYGQGGVLLDSTTVTPSSTGAFWGVSSDQLITRILVLSPTGSGELIDNLAFDGGGGGVMTFVMVPTLMNDVCHGFNGPWEAESNNSPAQANGYLCFGRNYLGNANADGGGLMNDYFHFDLPQGRTAVIDVTNFLQIAQVQLLYYTDTSNPVSFIVDQSSGNYHLVYSGLAGRYYIRLVSTQPQAQTYTLRVRLQ